MGGVRTNPEPSFLPFYEFNIFYFVIRLLKRTSFKCLLQIPTITLSIIPADVLPSEEKLREKSQCVLTRKLAEWISSTKVCFVCSVGGGARLRIKMFPNNSSLCMLSYHVK